MTEFELKFQLPREAVVGVLRALERGKTARQLLQARYFDTADGALARHGATLRVRKEGRRWVQTAKAQGDSALHRLEHEVAVQAPPTAGAVPAVDWRLHAGTPAGDVIAKALSARPQDDAPLAVVYQTHVQRIKRVIRSGRSSVEVALDRGWIEANGERAGICEIEFELKQGEARDAIALARRWCAAHGGWLSIISKAEQGQRLARKQAHGPAQVARDAAQEARAGDEFGRAVLHACLEQILANASEVAGGSTEPEHVHQLRVGVRRLRTAMRELSALMPAVDADWESPWIRFFRELGRHRDSGFVAQLQERLEAAGGPALPIAPDALGPADPVAAVRSPDWQHALLAMLGWMHRPDWPASTGAKGVKVILAKRLGKLFRSLLKEGRNFAQLPPQRQHRARKRLKRLRYLAEFSRHHFHEDDVQSFVEALKPAQDALGDYNDEALALGYYADRAAQEPRAWFGAGWLAARRPVNAAACEKALRALADLRPFWK
ncbi:MAG: CYTH and CHAD domain-containing protein [Ramlibacter sp.]